MSSVVCVMRGCAALRGVGVFLVPLVDASFNMGQSPLLINTECSGVVAT